VRECGRRRVTVGVDPEDGPVMQQQVIEHERLENRDATTPIDIQERDAIVERGEEVVGGRIGSVNEILIAIRPANRPICFQSIRHQRGFIGHTRLDAILLMSRDVLLPRFRKLW
jgi:hypothetical protein